MLRNLKSAGVVLMALVLTAVFSTGSLSQEKPTKHRFAFRSGKVDADCTQVLPGMIFTKERGFGLDLESKILDFKPFFFSIALAEGNYDVNITLGNAKGESETSVLSESRRLMLENVKTEAGKFETRTITVNIRNSKLADGGQVKLKDREIKGPVSSPVLHWDDKLTLEFAGKRPCVAAIEIIKNDQAATVYLAGDSTVTDQMRRRVSRLGADVAALLQAGRRRHQRSRGVRRSDHELHRRETARKDPEHAQERRLPVRPVWAQRPKPETAGRRLQGRPEATTSPRHASARRSRCC